MTSAQGESIPLIPLRRVQFLHERDAPAGGACFTIVVRCATRPAAVVE